YGAPDHGLSKGTGGGDSGSAPTVAITSDPKADGYSSVRGATEVFSTASTGPAIQSIQQRLTDLGYWLGPVNGVYGDLTTHAVYAEGPLGRLYRPKYFHPDGIALHGYTQVPPRPASHGCVRFTNAAIDFIWNANLAPIGTTVWVYGVSPGTPGST